MQKTWMTMCVAGALLGLHAGQARAAETKTPVEYVRPNIGGIGQLLTPTIPYVQYPYGTTRLAQVTTPGITDRYLADKIYGFPAGPAMLMVSTGEVGTHAKGYASEFDHDFETATPYYYAVNLDTSNAKAELTVGERSAYYRFTFAAETHAHVVLSLRDHAEIAVVGDRVVQGSGRIHGNIASTSDAGGETRQYMTLSESRGRHGTGCLVRGRDLVMVCAERNWVLSGVPGEPGV
ncbi:MAG TPA: hypothetical protein VGG95_12845 [Edaphobacter sp.]|jgi:putative alpha-1,2-mannosidase